MRITWNNDSADAPRSTTRLLREHAATMASALR
ncbi:hypothetical protein SALBM311S_00275 [Streptomyces alboniger]